MTNEPPGDGWRPYLDPARPTAFCFLIAGRVLEIWRREWGNETKFLTQSTSHPEFNVSGLYWRPA